MLTTLVFALEIKFVLKIESNARGILFFRALAASCVLYNRTEHGQGSPFVN